MSVASQSYLGLLSTAQSLGCCGVEVRNDLNGELFDGLTPRQAASRAADHGLRVLALSEVKAFNVFDHQTAEQTKALIDIAVNCGAEAISLIPSNDNSQIDKSQAQDNLLQALSEIAQLLSNTSVQAFVEPLGFQSCSLRFKQDVIDALDTLGLHHQFKLVHDTFHHHLAGETRCFAANTGIVHISGVVEKKPAISALNDAHRVLVSVQDRLANIEQLNQLALAGYNGAVSFEAFAPSVHQLSQPGNALRESMNYITSELEAIAA